MKFEYCDYPSIFKKADKLSVKSQKNFLLLIKIDMALLVIAAFLSILKFPEFYSKEQLILVSLLIIASLIATIFIHFSPCEGQWYGARAVAESFKSLTWKFIIGSTPFKISSSKAETNFLSMYEEVLSEKKELLMIESLESDAGEAITDKMKIIRSLSLDERLNLYVDQRLEEQRKWYSEKSNISKRNKNWLFGFIVTFQAMAVVWSLLRIGSPNYSDITPLFSAIVIALIGWNQIKKFNELSISYNLASEELSIIKAKKRTIDSEEKLISFVSDSENAISREHTMWVARRDNF